PWLLAHTAAEIVELGGLFRVPVAFIGNGRDLFTHPQLVARESFVDHPSGEFRQPRSPFRFSSTPVAELGPVPAAGSSSIDVGSRSSRRPQSPLPSPDSARGAAARPLEGVRILDFTAFWAGPAATHVLR